MEFIGNRMNVKELCAIFTVAFFTGRINFFEGTFPAAMAFVIVMLAVSTVYIYLLPAICGAVALYSLEGYFVYGELLALVLTGMFFLFFHRRKFTINQRIVIGGAMMVSCNLLVYEWWEMLAFLQPETCIKSLAALYVYVKVLNTVAKVLFVGKPKSSVSRERVALALEILLVSLVGALGQAELVQGMWLLMVGTTLYSKGPKEALGMTAMTLVYTLCQGSFSWQMYPGLFAGLFVAWYAMPLVERKYRKTLVGVVLFLFTALSGGALAYCSAVAMALLIILPEEVIATASYKIEARFMPELSTEKDLRHLEIRRDLQKKREAFVNLSRLYGNGIEGKQIVSYQFLGMARTIDRLLEDLQCRQEIVKEPPRCSVSVGQASYSFASISGDSMAAFSFGVNQVALVISDGMGKGSRAAEESKLVVTTLSKLLQAGFDVDLAMKTINGILMAGNSEARFATVDLAIIDRQKCRAKIYKMGAATTFIKHDGKVSMLKRQALPAGITSGLDLEYIDIKLKRGDLLVMVSDGVTDCDRKDYNCDWLRARLLEIGSRDSETIAELIVNKAVEKYGIHERDDLSVLIAAIGV